MLGIVRQASGSSLVVGASQFGGGGMAMSWMSPTVIQHDAAMTATGIATRTKSP